MSNQNKLFNKDFSLVVTGQIISLFGNDIICFALPLYLLNQTGSAALFGTVTALATLPALLLTPIGGIIADRVNKRNIMVVLDFSTALLMAVLFILLGKVDIVILIVVVLMILFGIQGAYQPSVQASIPALLDKEHLLQGNAIINQVNTLSGLLAPILGGIVFVAYGINHIIIIGGFCFLISAIMEMFISIPHQKREIKLGFFSIVKQDISESFRFMKNEEPTILKIVFIFCTFNLFLSALLIISLPVLVTETLGLSNVLYGISQGMFAMGGLIGGILVGIFAKKLSMKNIPLFLTIMALLLLPVSMTLFLNPSPMISYFVIVSCFSVLMCVSFMLAIQVMAYIQSVTPPHLIGKVISSVMALAMCASPIGFAMYGFLFDYFEAYQYAIIFIASIISLLIALFAKIFTFSKI